MRVVARKEKKFLCDIASAALLEGRISGVLEPDSHNGPRGYSVRSLYFDTPSNRDYHERLDGVDPRRKVRLRVYDPKSPTCLLELKQKEGEHQVKRSLVLERKEGIALIEGDTGVLIGRSEPFAAELYALMSANAYRPVSVVEYDRTAFVAKENRIRVTFDRGICATESNFNIFDPELSMYPVFDPFDMVLEVKYNGFLLSYIREMLNSVDKSEVAVSKYLLSRAISQGYRF